MDLKVYYQKIRETEDSIEEASVLVISNETPDGGKAGLATEVPRRIGAKMIVEGRARRAAEAETQEFLQQKREAKQQADTHAAASRMEFRLVPANEQPIVRAVEPQAKE